MLESATKIEPQDWMTDPQTGMVMDALAERLKPQALFVGGCVRNALLGQLVKDVDIATLWTPEEVTERLTGAGVKVIPTGLAHGTVTAVVMGRHFEITTLRKDVETDGRRAVVSFTDDWAEDAQRRDFTMNTLLADVAGNVYDPTGRGIEDLQARHVIFVGDPSRRIAEDYLRILRFFRFHALYGKGEPDKKALKACHAAAGKIETLSRERITSEFLRILSVDNPVEVLNLMFKNKVLTEIISEKYEPDILDNLCMLQKKHGLEDVVARLFVLAGLRADHRSTMERFLIFTNNYRRSFDSMARAFSDLKGVSEGYAKRLIYKYGSAYAVQTVLLLIAYENPQDDMIVPLIKGWEPPFFPLTGDDVIAAGVTNGVEIGRLLGEIKEWWLDNEFQPTRQRCLEKLKQAIKGDTI